MKINKQYLEKIIKEELELVLKENYEEEGYEEEGLFKNLYRGAKGFAQSMGREKTPEDIAYEKEHGTAGLAKQNLKKAWGVGKQEYQKSAGEREEDTLTPAMNKIQKKVSDAPFKAIEKVGEKFGVYSNKNVEAKHAEQKIKKAIKDVEMQLNKYAQKYGALRLADPEKMGGQLEADFSHIIDKFKRSYQKAGKDSGPVGSDDMPPELDTSEEDAPVLPTYKSGVLRRHQAKRHPKSEQTEE